MKKVNGVFFDLYGTLLEYGDMTAAWQLWLDALHSTLQGAGLAIDREAFAKVCDGFLARPEPPTAEDGLTVYERRIKVLAVELGLSLNDGRIREAAAASAGAWQRHVTLDPEAKPVLGSLDATKQLALVSNFDHPPHLYATLSRHGLSGFFDTIVVSSEVGVKKPDPEIFASALATASLPPRQVAYVGDSDEDVEAAQRAGLIPIRIERSGDTGQQRGADFRARPDSSSPKARQHDGVQTIRRLSELVEILGLAQE
jgi:HAD superfamily hydrolase (TIGR01509 family)